MLPKVYEMDDYDGCIKDCNRYCKVNVNFSPENPESLVWKIIQERKQMSFRYFDRSAVHRFMCVPKENATNEEEIRQYCTGVLNDKFQNTSLIPGITKIDCHSDACIPNQYLTPLHIIILACTLLYIAWIIFATVHDMKANQKRGRQKANEWISQFSLRKNWKTLTSLKENGDATKLRCIQTMRVFTLLHIILSHTLMATTQVYIENVEFLEMAFQLTVSKLFMVSILFVVQPFFVISSWIVTNQICDIFKRNGEFTLKDCLVLFVNRLFRFWPSLILFVILFRQSHILYGPQTYEVMNMQMETCSKFWHPTLLYYNNFFKWNQICFPVSWYLSADTHFYIAALATCYVVLKFKLNMLKVLSSLMVLSMAIFAIVKYCYGLPVVNPTLPTGIIRENWFDDETYIMQYTASYASWSNSIVGMVIGYVYNCNKNTEFNHGKAIRTLWALALFGLPAAALILAIIFSDVDSPICTALLGVIVKPIFGLGIGLGMLGIVQGIGGSVKRLFEWTPLVIFGNFTFSTYLWHPLPAFLRGYFTRNLFHVDPIEGVFHQMFIFLVSATMGVTFCLIFEQPCLNLQKKILPQVRTRRKEISNGVEKKDS